MKTVRFSSSLLLSVSAIGQPLSRQQKNSSDSLFVIWDSANKPGITVAVVRNYEQVYSRTVGMAEK
jgi:hypothetical protein